MKHSRKEDGAEKPKGRARRREAALSILLAASAFACRRATAPRPPAPAASAAAPSVPRIAAIPTRYGLREGERQTVEDFLRRHPNLRLPNDDDRRASASGDSDMRHLYGVYLPYFVRGDLNDDGILDFVIAFVRRDSSPSTPWFTVVVFTGKDGGPPSAPSFGPEVFLERDITLAAGDIAIDRDAVVITPDLEDETSRRYRWDPARRSFVFVRDDEPETQDPGLSRT
jgi:hypothetical protein